MIGYYPPKHPGLLSDAQQRLFVLHPLREINPNWQSPTNSKKISLIIAKNKINKDNKITKL
ncbi:MAG: hypothetical protein EBW63_03595 [Proteobacteria bacterium]|nr:hypothetical protein [Pseudomonadota bacterium]